MKIILILLLICTLQSGQAQQYFPPLNGGEWATTDPSSLDFCPDRIDSLYALLEEADSKSFILIKDGRIVLEHYFGTYTQDSLWYWASAGKSLASMLVGVAQSEGLLDIDEPTSTYLGEGWTTAPADKEALITIKHQISMATGLADNLVLGNCEDPSCLTYEVDAGERWSYYNAPYRRVLDVLEEASGSGINIYTYDAIGSRIGMGGLWIDKVRYGKARDLARFGLLALNEGIWDNDTILSDQQYFEEMKTQSQDFNEAYGYLWWLNGSETSMLPSSQIIWPTELIPSGPDDMYAALGKNDQKIYVVPSQSMVVVRQGNSAGQALAGPSSFDEDLWVKINELVCAPDGIAESTINRGVVYPNPVNSRLSIRGLAGYGLWTIQDLNGKTLLSGKGTFDQLHINVEGLDSAQYILSWVSSRSKGQTLFLKN